MSKYFQKWRRYCITNQLNIGVLGLTAPWGGIYEIFDLHFPDFSELAEIKIQELHQKCASIIIVLSHLGLEDDRRLVETVSGIDLIIGGHSHNLLPTGEIHNGDLIAQAGDYAQYLGRVDLTISADTSQVLSLSAQLLEVPTEETPDQAVLDAITMAEAEAKEFMSQSIGTLKVELNLDHYNECGIGNLAADVLKERMGAEAAMIASGQFHTGLPAGRVSLGQLDKACFSSANPGLTEVKGIQILNALERGLDPNVIKLEPPSNRGTPIGIPQISGLRIWYDAQEEVGKRILHVSINGEPILPDRLYRLAHTDAEVSTEVGYLKLEEGQDPTYEVPTILPEVIEEYLRGFSPIPKPQGGRWIENRVKK
jgi:2',3'-cyclic-nucleotide 2'-phosphodiesterase (5'-nucleotidase family)